MRVATVAERPELVEPAWERTKDTLPEYNNHGDVLNVYWGRLTEERPEFQFHLVDDDDAILARAGARSRCAVEDLPDGIDGAIARGFDEGGVDALCALVIMVPRDVQSRGVSGLAVDALRELARTHGFSSVMRITGTVAEWEEWVGMPFPDSSGEHWFPHGLATVSIDRDADSGRYWEPNVWMHHGL